MSRVWHASETCQIGDRRARLLSSALLLGRIELKQQNGCTVRRSKLSCEAPCPVQDDGGEQRGSAVPVEVSKVRPRASSASATVAYIRVTDGHRVALIFIWYLSPSLACR